MNEYYNDEVPMYLRRAFSEDETENEETQVAPASDEEVSDATDEAIQDVVEDANNQVSEQKVQAMFSDLFSEALATRLYSEILESDESDMDIDVDGIAEETADKVMNHIAEEAADEIYPEVREAVAEKISQKVQSYYDPYFGQMMYADEANFNDGGGLDDGENAYDDDFEYVEGDETPLAHLEDMAPEMVTQSYDPDFYYDNGMYSDYDDMYYDDVQHADMIGLASKGFQKLDRARRKVGVGIHNTKKGLRNVGRSIKNAVVSTRDMNKRADKLYNKRLAGAKWTRNRGEDAFRSLGMKEGAANVARNGVKNAWKGVGSAIKQNKRALGTAAGAAALVAGAGYGAKKLYDRYKKRRNHNAYDEFYYDNGMYSDMDDMYYNEGMYSEPEYYYYDNGMYSDADDMYYDESQQADFIGAASKALNWGAKQAGKVKGGISKVGKSLKEVAGATKTALKKTKDVGAKSNQLYDKALSNVKWSGNYAADVAKSVDMKNAAANVARNGVKNAWKGVGSAIKNNGKTLGKAGAVAGTAAAAYGGKKLYDKYKSRRNQSYDPDFYYDNGMYSDMDPEYEQHMYANYDPSFDEYYGQNQYAGLEYTPSLESQVADILDTGSSRLFCDQSSLEDDVTNLL